MILFWVVIVMMIGVSGMLIIVPLNRRQTSPGLATRSANIAIYQARQIELDAEHAAALIGDEEYTIACEELESALLDDVGDVTGVTAKIRRSGWSVFAAAALIPVLSLGLYVEYGSYELTEPGTLVSKATSSEPPTLESMVGQLQEHLADNPKDKNGWAMLGRTYAAMKQYRDAAQAYAQSYAAGGKDDPEILVDYAEVLALSRDNDLLGTPQQLFERAIELEPNQPKGLWYLGLVASQRGNATQAVEYWEHLRGLTPPGSEQAQLLEHFLGKLRETAGMDITPQTFQQSTAAQGGAIKVSVSLAQTLAGQVSDNTTVFIFARRASGPPMPLAVIKKTVADLPVTVVLDDSMAMMAGNSLSSAGTVVVGARISKGGGPIAQSGDLQGLSDAITLPVDGNVNIDINTVVE